MKRIVQAVLVASLIIGSGGSPVFSSPIVAEKNPSVPTHTANSIAIAGNNTLRTNGHEKLLLESTDVYDVTTAITSNVTWSINHSSGRASIDRNGNFTSSVPGTYDVTATYHGESYAAKVIVSNGAGVAVGYKFEPGNSTLLYGDPSGPDMITVTAVDSRGDLVTNYTGEAAISLKDISNNLKPAIGIGPAPLPLKHGDSYPISDNLANMNQKVDDFTVDLSTGRDTLHFQNGKAVFQISPSPLGDTYRVTVSDENPISALKPAVYTAKSVSATPTMVNLVVDKSYYFLYPANADQVHAYVKISFSNGHGITQFSSGKTIPVTLRLTGPGSFSPHTRVTKQTVPVNLLSYSGAMKEVEIFCPLNLSGKVRVEASAPGLKGSSVSFSTYRNTEPASLGVTREANGEYTVTLLDTKGHRVMTAKDTLEITDNAKVLGEAPITYMEEGIHLYNFKPDFRMFGGTFQFQAESKSRLEKPVTLTIVDKTLGFRTTTQFTGPPVFPSTESGVSLTLRNGSHDVAAGQIVTVVAQVLDQHGEPFKAPSQRLNFYIGDSTNTGVHFANGADGIIARTGKGGFAQVSIIVPSDAKSNSPFFIHAMTEDTQTPLASLALTIK